MTSAWQASRARLLHNRFWNRLGRIAVTALAFALPLPLQAETEWELVRSYPHDPGAFTEGLFFHDGALYESTGLEGRSEIRKVALKNGRVLDRRIIARPYFGEGIVNWKDRLVSVTWRHRTGFIWNIRDFSPISQFRYEGEGWGLTQDGHSIIMSDGTAQLRFLDPDTLSERRRVAVSFKGKPVERLNELEYVKGEIWANIWYDSRIARIDPHTGDVIDWIDIAPLLMASGATEGESVANGIAYDAKGDRIFVTGKNWAKLFEIRVKR